MNKKDLKRFEAKLDKTGDCWEWLAAKGSWGYGLFHLGKLRGSHRVAYELYRGPIPEGMCVLHTCDNPGCNNPEHLWIGTSVENKADMVAKGRGRGKEQKGEKNDMAKLTELDVWVIKRMLEHGVKQPWLAGWFGVTGSCISKINTGERWKHVA